MNFIMVNGVMLPAVSIVTSSSSIGSDWSEEVLRMMSSRFPSITLGTNQDSNQLMMSSDMGSPSSNSTAMNSNTNTSFGLNGNAGIMGNYFNAISSAPIAYVPVKIFNPSMCFVYSGNNGYGYQPMQSSPAASGSNSDHLMLVNASMTMPSYGQGNRAVSINLTDSSSTNNPRYHADGSPLASLYNSNGSERIVTLEPSTDMNSSAYSRSVRVPDRETALAPRKFAPKRPIPPAPKLSRPETGYSRYDSSCQQLEREDGQGHDTDYSNHPDCGFPVIEETADEQEFSNRGSVSENLRDIAPHQQGRRANFNRKESVSGIGDDSGESSCGKRTKLDVGSPPKKSKYQDDPSRTIKFKVKSTVRKSFLAFNPFLFENKEKGKERSALFVPTKKKDMQVLQSLNLMMDSMGVWKRRLSKTGDSLYKELDVSKFAGESEIDNAYNHLSARYHPEVFPGNKEVLQAHDRINRAHRILKDAKKKAIYDEYGSFGLHIAERYGEEELETVSILVSTWFQLVTMVTCCFGCGCCCCCFCCDGFCGLCIKEDSDSIEARTPNQSEIGSSSVCSTVPPPTTLIVTQPAQQRQPDDDDPVFVISGDVESCTLQANSTHE